MENLWQQQQNEENKKRRKTAQKRMYTGTKRETNQFKQYEKRQ